MSANLALPIAIIGGGGLGSNLVSVLREQGYINILLIDDDVSDLKFLGRYVFFNGISFTNTGIPKTEVIQRTINNRKNIAPNPLMHIPSFAFSVMHAKVDESFDYSALAGRFCIITTDSVVSREVIERNLKKKGLQFVHAGCNLGSGSIFRTIEDVLGDEEIAGAETSYDIVPDAKTYLTVCCAVASYLDGEPVRIWIEDEEETPFVNPTENNTIEAYLQEITLHV